MAITPSPFMLLEATPVNGPLHFIASTERGHVQISGRGDRWGASELREHRSEPRVLPGRYPTPADASEVLGRYYDLAPYRHADVYCRWRDAPPAGGSPPMLPEPRKGCGWCRRRSLPATFR